MTGGRFSYPPGSGGGGGAGDLLSAALNAITSLTNADGNLAYDTWHVVKATTGAHTVTLPAPALSSGKPQLVGVLVDPTSTKLVTLAPHGAETIDGASSRILWAGESAVLLTDGTNWFKVAGKSIPMCAQMYLTAAQSIADATITAVNIDTTLNDNTGLLADPVNHRINVQRTGVYDAVGGVQYSAFTGRAQVQVYKNGIAGILLVKEEVYGAGGYPAPCATTVGVSLASGDYVQTAAYQQSGAANALFVDVPGNILQLAEKPSW
jgi:hypothetical protein